MNDVQIIRLGPGQSAVARKLFAVMAAVFDEECESLDDGYLERLLSRADFWAIAALSGDDLLGGLTAHTLPMTRTASSEIFIYDIAVRSDVQRQGIGRRLVMAVREQAAAQGIRDLFVPADDEDQHALDFYLALGGAPSPVTIFSFSNSEDPES